MTKEHRTVTVHAKPWWASRTLIFNALSLAVVAAGFVAQSYGALSLPESAGTWATLVVALGNAALRLITTTPIEGTPAANPPATDAQTSG